MDWKPSSKSCFAGVGKSRKTFNLNDDTCESLALKSAQTKKSQGEIIDELVKSFIERVEARGDQFVGMGHKKESIDKLGFQCQSCGATAKDAQLHIDHIAPTSLFPELSKHENNLQILCKRCNVRKGNKFIRDYRRKTK